MIEAPTRRLASVGVVVDIDQRTATVDGRELDLTFLEFELLAHLMAQPKRVMSRSQLMEAVWGRPNMGDTRTVSTHVARIRRKLGRPTAAPSARCGRSATSSTRPSARADLLSLYDRH